MSLFKSQTRLAMAYTNEVGDKIYPVIVDIKKGIKSTEEIQFMSSDINTGVLSVAFIQGNDNYNVSGAEVVCSVMRPDASTLELPCTIVENNIVEVPLGINGTSQDGIYSFDFKVFKGGNKVVGTPIMNYSVSLSISNDNAVLEDDRLPVLTMLMTQITTLKNETNNVISTANTAIQNANKATDNTKLAISNAQSATQKAEDVVTRVNNAIASGTQDLEVKEARDGEVSLNARLDRDIEKAKQVYVGVEGNYVSTDSSSGYLKDVEILGNTVQDASNLADIRSVGDTVEGQELYEIPVLSCGKNLFSGFVQDTSSSSNYYDNSINTYISSTRVGNESFYTCIKVNGSGTYLNFIKEGSVEFAYKYTNTKPTNFADAFISTNIVGTTYAPNTNGYKYLVITFRTLTNGTLAKIKDIMVSEGTVATPYEPYQEDKTTILSPVQLEKVGDVADRIICKDGVWGVEKNIGVYYTNGNETIYTYNTSTTNTIAFRFNFITTNTRDIIVEGFSYRHDDSDIEHCLKTSNDLIIYLNRSRLETQDAQGFSKWLKDNKLKIIYQTTQPTFIPLPHDQQIKLRTFANKTNILFGCEIEGTIKAQVPKSLGATVNTHTEQIRSLNNELNRVKKLEESTVSTVTTESDFTTVEATSNGYFEDVKLEGKTLVNLSKLPKSVSGRRNYIDWDFGDKEYTLICNALGVDDSTTFLIASFEGDTFIEDLVRIKIGTTNTHISVKFNTKSAKRISLHCQSASSITISNVILLEGDHTQNPPSYFEGLKSVGQSATTSETDEIVVSSVNKNLFDGNPYNEISSRQCFYVRQIDKFDNLTISYDVEIKSSGTGKMWIFLSNTYSNTTNHDQLYQGVVANGKGVEYTFSKTTTINTSGYKYMYFTSGVSNGNGVIYKNIQIEEGVVVTEYAPHQSDKKRLLYYNNETQAWEKPVLREWDSIEKHSDGKYYYHQRSGEVVLNGSESWAIFNTMNQNDTLAFHVTMNLGAISSSPNNTVCDKFSWKDVYVNASNEEGHNVHLNSIRFSILKSKLPTQDVQGFKQWLQANNVTVVYQLAQEKVYECTNIDLITYANETNYIVESGAIAPKTILKVHNNISNVVKILQQKVSLLENKFIEGLKQVLAGDMYSLAELLYPEDFVEENPENNIMLLPFE